MTKHYNINWLQERFEAGDNLKFLYFWGHTNKYNEQVGKFCLSQWFESPFTVDNVSYKTTEHWMMAHKALVFGDKNNFAKIIHCNTPAEAKKLGREVIGYDEQIWDKHKFEIVKLGNIHKFNQHPDYAAYLLQTENRILVEASPVDAIWGIGLSQDSKDIDNIYAWRGQNLLGFALMETRDFLQSFGHFQPLTNAMEPPWKMFPDIDASDLFWRMGKGEDYLIELNKYYIGLTAKEKVIYRMTILPLNEWHEFYEDLPNGNIKT